MGIFGEPLFSLFTGTTQNWQGHEESKDSAALAFKLKSHILFNPIVNYTFSYK